MAATKPFEPITMPVGVLTAALQELTPRERRDPDPDLAIEEWLQFAAELGVDCIELSAALHPSFADVPPEAMLDPVANTLDLRDPFDEQRAKRNQACGDPDDMDTPVGNTLAKRVAREGDEAVSDPVHAVLDAPMKQMVRSAYHALWQA